MASRTRTVADGQLATTAASILSGADVPGGYVEVLLSNTGTSEETVILTYQRAGGTARRLARVVLQGDEQAVVVGIAMQPDDTLLGVTTTASVADYLIFETPPATFRVDVLDPEGTGKGVTAIRKVLTGIQYLTDGELVPS